MPKVEMLRGFASVFRATGILVSIALVAAAMFMPLVYGEQRIDELQIRGLLCIIAFETVIIAVGLAKILEGVSVSLAQRSTQPRDVRQSKLVA
jgi:hypothetical protein